MVYRDSAVIRMFGVVLVIVAFCGGYGYADTFTHRQTGKVYHGYAARESIEGKTLVHTQKNGELELNLAEYEIEENPIGRNNVVAVLSVPTAIRLEMEVEAFGEAIKEEADAGPLFILIEIDTPGGRIDLAKKLCAIIIQTRNCRTVAFIKSGEYGGAYSAGAAIAFACDEIYMAPGTVIGAATAITYSASGKPIDLKKALGEVVAEKASSGWRNYLATLAQQNGRPGLLAKAMEDKDIEVVEVTDRGKRLFVEPFNMKSNQRIVYTWSKKGSLLTLPAADALKCGMADELAPSRAELLGKSGAASAEIRVNTRTDDVRKLFKKINRKYEKLDASLDAGLARIRLVKYRAHALKVLKGIRDDTRKIMLLKKRYPDVPVDLESMQKLLNVAEAHYETTKTMR